MGILLGLLSSVGFGTSDFIARFSTRRIGTYRTLFYMQFVGAIVLTVYVILSGEATARIHGGTFNTVLLTFAQSALTVVGSFALYRSFELGTLSVVSPIAASYAAFTVLLSVLVGESLSVARLIGVVLAIVGVVLASISKSHAPAPHIDQPPHRGRFGLPAGVDWAILASACYSISFWVLGFFITPTLGGVVPIWLYRLTSIVVMFAGGLLLKNSIALPKGAAWLPVIAIGILDTTAYVLMTVGLTTDQVSVVTVLSSLFTAVTVLMAWIFLRERLRWYQWLGVALIMIGIASVSLEGGAH